MSEIQLASISHRHQAIADWLLANPAEKLYVCATAMGVSQPWLSAVIHSKLFVEYFQKRRAVHEGFLREQITGAQLAVTLQALNKLSEIIADEATDGRLILDTAERTAKLLGYEPRPSMRVIEEKEVSFAVGANVLADARARLKRTLITERPATAEDLAALPQGLPGEAIEGATNSR